MGELVRVDTGALPAESQYRPLSKGAWFSRSLPLALGLGLGIGVLSIWISPLLMWVSVAGLVGYSIWRRRRMYQFLRENDDGVALLGAGDLEAASATFDRLCKASRRMPALHSLFVFNRAVAHLESGELDRARALLLAVVHAGWIGQRGALGVYYSNLLGRLAIVEALLGELDAAQGWRTRAHGATSAAKQGVLLLVDVVVEARLGKFERVAELVEEGWRRAENLMNAKHLRVVRLMQAFALEQSASSDYRAISRESEQLRALEAARGGQRGEFDYLCGGWESLAEFLQRHDLR